MDTTTPSPRFLIVRLSSLGDVLHALPIACALRDKVPGAHIAWAVEAPFADALRDHPAVDQLFVVPRRWLKSPREILNLRAQLRAANVDIALDPQGLFKSALAARLSGARRRIGFARPQAREGASLLYTETVTPTARHVVDQNLQLLGPLDAMPDAPRWDMPAWPATQKTVDAWLRENRLEPGRFLLLNPGAGWASKRWPTRRYSEVARTLSLACALPSVIAWHGPEERAWAEEIVVYMHGGTSITVGPDGPMVWGETPARLAPPTTVPELACLARRARLFLGSDTGPLHLAAAVGTPCVGLFGASSGERNGPYGAGCVTLQRELLEGSSRARRRAGPEAMLALSSKYVEAACLERLGGPARGTPR